MRLAILSFVLFLSGISALILETLWLRLSGLAFGNSVWSAALILSSFMAGLALGSVIASRYRLRRVPALRVYALLEITIGVLGCTIVFGIPLLGEWLRPLFQMLWTHDALMNAVRLLISFLILLVPTTAMGLSLPVVLEDDGLRRHPFANAVSLLYGCNTLGAVVGALVGEAWLVEAFGLWGTGIAAGLLNCTAALVAWFLATGGETETFSQDPHPTPARRPARFLVLSFGAGFLLLLLEVVWFRFLRLFVASSPTAFAIMLAVVLAGIGLGAVLSSPLRAAQRLPFLLALAGVLALACYFFFPIQLVGGGDFYLDRWHEIALLSIALMFPVSFVSGVLFPAIATRVQEVLSSRMNSAGVTTLYNTLGAAAGPILASFVLLPMIGYQRALFIAAVIYLVLAWLAREPGRSPRLMTAAPAIGSVLAVLLVALSWHRDEMHFAHARGPFVADGSDLVRRIEGNSDTLQLLRREAFGEAYYYRLLTNAFTMSDTRYQNQRYMRTFAYLPLTLQPEARDALLICFGCGITADALVHDRGLQHIDFVDISREVFSLAPDYTGSFYSNPLGDPRVTKFVQDGRFFLQAANRQYDVITGEPPPPKVAGTVNLYTEEFFRLMRSRLKEGGIASFWLPINQLKVEEVKAILRGFHNAFPNASVWGNADYEWIMLGINGPGRSLGEPEARRLWDDTKTYPDLDKIGLEKPAQLPALFLMDAAEIEKLTAETKPLSDFFPKRLSDVAADRKETHQFALGYMEAKAAARRFRDAGPLKAMWPETIASETEPYFIVRDTRYRSEQEGSNKLAELDFFVRKFSLRAPVLEVLNEDPLHIAIAERAASNNANPAEMLRELAAGALARRDFNATAQFIEGERAQGMAERNDLLLLIYAYCMNNQVEKAETVANEAKLSPEDRTVSWLYGKLQAEFGFRPPRF